MCLCKTYIILAHDSTEGEIHQFRWSASADLNQSSCAVPIVPPRHLNTTLAVRLWSGASRESFLILSCFMRVRRELYYSGFIIFGATSAENRSANCFSGSSLFRLVGNPGIIWHPTSNQCVHAKSYPTDAYGDFPTASGKIVRILIFFRQDLLYKCESLRMLIEFRSGNREKKLRIRPCFKQRPYTNRIEFEWRFFCHFRSLVSNRH